MTSGSTICINEVKRYMLTMCYCVLYFCRPQIKVFIEGLFSFDQDIPAFKEHLRDFLVQIRVCVHLLDIIQLKYIIMYAVSILVPTA